MGNGLEDVVPRGVLVEQSGHLETIFAAQKRGERLGVVNCGLQFGQGRGIVVDADDECVIAAGAQVALVGRGLGSEATLLRAWCCFCIVTDRSPDGRLRR